MADDDLFIDQVRIQKMIAAGIYDEEMANKMKGIKNKDLKDNTMVRSAAERAPPRPAERQAPSFPSPNSRGRGRGFGRGQNFMGPSGRGRKPIDPLSNKFGFGAVSATAHKWQEMVPREDREQDSPFNKRPRSPSLQRDGFRDGFRDGIREGIQTKISRNETDRNPSNEFSERNAGNSSNDTDLRPKSDTDSRIRDIDLRPASNSINNRKTTPNLPNVISTANDPDYRRGDSKGARGGRDPSFVKSLIDQRFFGSNSQRSVENVPKKSFIDDIDDFIEKASSKLNLTPPEINALSSRGRGGGDVRSFAGERFYQSNDPLGLSKPEDPLGLRQSDDSLDSRQPEKSFNQRTEDLDSRPEINEAPKEADENPIAILKETVEELAKSNLFCQYCDKYLSSLGEVNVHIGTVDHQKNMAKKVMEENNSAVNNTQPMNRVSQTVVERVPTGMAAIVQILEQKKQITLKTLTEMDNYEITCDSEAALAKELAKLLTNELLNYKMNLMPDTVKEALKSQGIGLLNSMVSN